MEKTVKLILVSLLTISLYSCTSSDISETVYRDFKNFTSRIEVSSDTVYSGQTLYVKLIVKNNSDEKDSIANFDDWRTSIGLVSYVKDTLPCVPERFDVTDCGGVPYTVFLPKEEKYIYRYFTNEVIYCSDSLGRYKIFSRYLSPAIYKAGAGITVIVLRTSNYAGSVNSVKSVNSSNIRVLAPDPDVIDELINCDLMCRNYGDKVSAKVLTIMNEYLEKYKNTIYEKEFFQKKLYFMHSRAYPLNEIDLHLIENYIEQDPDYSGNGMLLWYYKIARFYQMSDSVGGKKYLTLIAEKYKNKKAGMFAKEELIKKY